MDVKFDQFWASFEALLEKWASQEGLPVRPGGLTATAARRQLVAMGTISASDVVVVAGLNSAVEYANRSNPEASVSPGDEIDHRGTRLPARHRAGGIITPQ